MLLPVRYRFHLMQLRLETATVRLTLMSARRALVRTEARVKIPFRVAFFLVLTHVCAKVGSETANVIMRTSPSMQMCVV